MEDELIFLRVEFYPQEREQSPFVFQRFKLYTEIGNKILILTVKEN